MDALEIISAREKDLGGFTVRRILPYAHCMLGPFIFFDHMGPAKFEVGQGIDVRPHPHIHLATVTYLFEGKILHRDSLGSEQLIVPGDLNWMVAGHGIVHSERTPQDMRQSTHHLNGIQCWLALPKDQENIKPSFTHYSKNTLPFFEENGVHVKQLLGHAFSQQSPVKVLSDLFYLELSFQTESAITFPLEDRELGIYLVEGQIQIHDQVINAYEMVVPTPFPNEITIKALKPSRVMLLGGKPVGQRFIYWNFVSSSQENIQEAKHTWSNGPGAPDSRFPTIPGDDKDYIPLPEEEYPLNPKGTIM